MPTSRAVAALLFALSMTGTLGCSAGAATHAPQTTPAPVHTRASTAQVNVSLFKELLPMPGLGRARQVRIYLPPSYATSTKRYPVLYMHDAQNLFDDATAYAGEWGVDETMNALAKSGQLELLVVGIDNGQALRMSELNPWTNAQIGKSEGALYMQFIVGTLKPLIDKHYRTAPERANTAIMGSSMGALISHYAINHYPDVFSKAGLFSPSYWVSSEAFAQAANRAAARDARLYWMTGEKEGGTMASDSRAMYDLILKHGHPAENVSALIVPGGQHNEALWRAQFKDAVLWMFKK